MIKNALYVAALAAVACGTLSPVAMALDSKAYAVYSAGKSSDDSWDKCDDDDDKKFGKSFKKDDDKKKCVTKKYDDKDKDKKYGNNGGGNGGDPGNPGSYKGKTEPLKTDFASR